MTSQKGLRYDGSIEKYPITEGEIYSLGNGSKITIADITLGLPEFSKNADCVFIDPAGSKGVLKAYYTKAEKQCPVDNFDEFVAHSFRYRFLLHASVSPQTGREWFGLLPYVLQG